MKKSELLFNVIAVPVDLLLILFAATIAYFLRYEVETLPVLFDLSYRDYMKLVLVAAPFLLLLFALSGLYTQKSTRGIWRELGRVATAVSAGLMIVVVLFFFDRNLFPSRLIILIGWFLAIFLVGLGRIVLLVIQRQMLARGIGRHRLVIIQGENNHSIIDEIEHDSKLGYKIVARLHYTDDIEDRIESMHRQERIDELMQADMKLGDGAVLKLVQISEQLGIRFNYLPNILESHRANVEIDVIGSMPIVRLHPTPLDGWGKVVKRILDIVISAIALLLFAPIFILITLIIRFDSPGPIFFHQRRGSSFHSFEFYKFRTMKTELSEGTAEGDRIRAELETQNSRRGPYVKIKNDPRVTGIGRVLRRFKFDELPQLWHVLRGQMSLVGPRVHMIREVEKFESRYKKIFTTIKPGATGLAQINQFYNPELPFDEEIKLDLFYIENWSVWLDMYIIFKTIVLLFTSSPKEDY
ncbi:MAG: sugar transferase [Candidatus Doudnabacteria bacterium]|nr:sugar transferase [Candidatus Doudnabacteria bacterium]